MATKQELEAKVAELEQRLAANPAAPPPVDADLLAARDSDILELRSEVQDLKDENEDLKRQVEDLKKVPAPAPLPEKSDVVDPLTIVDELVVLDGVRYQVSRKDTVLGVVHAWRKRFVEEDALALVLKRA